MNPRLTRIAPGLLAVLLATGGLAGLASAQTSAPTVAPAAMAPHPPMPRGGPGMHGHRMMRELDRLKTSLRLDPNQTALWDRAVAQMAPPAGAGERMKGQHERLTAALDDPAFDPRKLAAEMDRADGERRARMTATRDAWFAVYDSLNPVQRGQAREFLRSHLGRGHAMGGGMQRMHERMHGDRPHDGAGAPAPGMPPATR